MKALKLIESLTATFVIIVLGAPAIVLAGTPSHIEHRELTVSFADLNLKNDAGVRVLYQRLQRASEQVCGVISSRSSHSLTTMRDTSQCYRDSIAAAVDKIDNENLTRLHAG